MVVRRLTGYGFFVTIAALSISGCGSQSSSSTINAPEPVANMAISLATAEQRMIERNVIASGPVAAWEEIQIGVELNGVRITALHVDIGQQVHKGDLLLELDHRTLDSDLRQAQAVYGEAEAGVTLAKTNLARGENLSKNKLISASALDDLRNNLVLAGTRLTTTKAQLDAAQLRRDFATLRAPDDGVISKKLAQPGQVVSAGMELLRLIRQGRLEWRAELTEADLLHIKSGAKAWITGVDGKSIEGKVRTLSPSIEITTRTGIAYVDLPEPDGLKAGAFVEGRILIDTSPALMVPAAAVVKRDGYAYVFTVDEKNIAHRVRIRTGVREGEQIEVLEGLQVNDKVVERGAGFLSDGDAVRISADKNLP